MPPSGAKKTAPLVLVCGEDEFAVKQRAREIYQQWTEEVGGTDHEIIDGGVANSGEALRAMAKLREALQTLPFFGSGKDVWLKGCNFLGDERAASAQAVTESLAAGTPCLCSNAAALPEAGGELCRYFDPENLGAAYDAVCAVLDDRPGLAAWAARVRREFRATDWAETARAVLDQDRSFVGGR